MHIIRIAALMTGIPVHVISGSHYRDSGLYDNKMGEYGRDSGACERNIWSYDQNGGSHGRNGRSSGVCRGRERIAGRMM